MEIKQENVLDLLEQQHPALSSTNDMPVIETKPDSTPEKVEEAAPEEAELTAESATVDTDEQPGVTDEEPKKPPRGVQKRLDELTRQREEANRRAEALQASLDQALKLAHKPEAVVEEQEPAKPRKEDFPVLEDWETAIVEYASNLATYKAQKEVQKSLDEQQRLLQEESQFEKQREMADAYKARIETAKSKYADFDEVAERADVTLPMPVVQAILTEEDGAEFQYYFGRNPDEAKRFLSMTIGNQPDVKRQLMELGAIRERLNKPEKPSISNAPAPIKPHKAETTVKANDPANESMEQYVARRKKESASVRH